jgi:hypothetical protein
VLVKRGPAWRSGMTNTLQRFGRFSRTSGRKLLSSLAIEGRAYTRLQ